MYDGRKGSSSPLQQTVHLLSTAGRAAERGLTERLARRGMSRAHLSVLSALAEHGPHARPDLAATLGPDAAQASGVVDDLLSARLVESFHVQIGGRHEVVTLTPAGREALDRLHADAAAVQDGLLAPLTRGERAQLNALLHRVCALAARTGPAPSVPAQGPGPGRGPDGRPGELDEAVRVRADQRDDRTPVGPQGHDAGGGVDVEG
ncbi:MarR family winged helix-turn-helix transcriptional regulator [Kitasatospora sp. NPDC088346]|uniref:MarR family winged helix-turn-helix transcriptional regulator n=1 Tax=Kitasatospora sp. NPDC088346 TaxID=3364073 RepID=UPI00382233A4